MGEIFQNLKAGHGNMLAHGMFLYRVLIQLSFLGPGSSRAPFIRPKKTISDLAGWHCPGACEGGCLQPVCSILDSWKKEPKWLSCIWDLLLCHQT